MIGRFVANVAAITSSILLVWGIVWVLRHHSPIRIDDTSPAGQVAISYQDLVSIMLAAVSVILAALGFVVAVLAVIGWRSLDSRVASVAIAFLKKSVAEGGEIHDIVKSEAKSIIFRGIEPMSSEDEPAMDELSLDAEAKAKEAKSE